MLSRLPVVFILIWAVGFLTTATTTAQAQDTQLQILEPDASAFPQVSFHLIFLDNENRVIRDLSDLTLSEDGMPITGFELSDVDVGTEIIFVIDANTTIEDRDEADGLTRREKVRDSVIRYANFFMDPQQLDRVSVVVPDGEDGRFLDRPGLSFPNELINAVNFYETGELGEPDLNRMLEMALNQVDTSREEGRFQAIVLFSDAGELDGKLDYETLVESAQALEVPIYGAVLGSRADANELEAMGRLAEPTGGVVVHMPDPASTDPLYEVIQARGTRTNVSYRSGLTSSGSHTLAVTLGDSSAEAILDLVIQVPTVRIAVDNSRPIRRVATASDTPLEQMEPPVQPMVAQISWPDGFPRSLASAALLVNGVEVPLEAPVLNADGLLTFDWDIRSLDEGLYELQIQVTDELGLEGLSDPLPLAVEIQRPAAAATATPVPSPTPAPTEPVEPVSVPPPGLSRNVILVGGGLLVLLAMILLLSLGVLLVFRRRRAAPAVMPAPEAPVSPTARRDLDPGATYMLPPEFAFDEATGAYLEPLENASEHKGLIPIAGKNVAVGRDPSRVQIPLEDRSVSRLHARILESHGTYRLYDEGSSSGTYVNYERVGLTPRALEDKDDVHFGRVHLRFHLSASLQQGNATQFYDPSG